MSDDNMENTPPSGGVTPAPRDLALSGLSDAEKHEVVTAAADLGVSNRQDATWILIRKTRDGIEAARAAESAAARIEDATRSIGDLIFDQTIRAGADLQGGVKEAIDTSMTAGADTVAKIIVKAANRGASALTSAAENLENRGEEATRDFVNRWRMAAVDAVAKQARASLRRSIVMIGGFIFAALLLGGGVVWGLMDMTGHLLPWHDHIITVNGRPDCGYAQVLHGRVCAVR